MSIIITFYEYSNRKKKLCSEIRDQLSNSIFYLFDRCLDKITIVSYFKYIHYMISSFKYINLIFFQITMSRIQNSNFILFVLKIDPILLFFVKLKKKTMQTSFRLKNLNLLLSSSQIYNQLFFKFFQLNSKSEHLK